MYVSAYPSPCRPAAPKSHARPGGWDDAAPGEEPTKVAGVAGFVRTAVELLRRDPPAAHDMMRTTAELLQRRACGLGGAAGSKLATVAWHFEHAATTGDVSALLRAAGLKSGR